MDIISEVQKAIYLRAENIVAFELEVAEILEIIGKTHYKAAIQNLRDTKISSNPKRELELAIGHLQSAYQQFMAIVPQGFLGLVIEILEHMTLRINARSIEGFRNAYQTALLIALCYAALGERELTERYIKDTISDFDFFYESYIDQVDSLATLASIEWGYDAKSTSEMMEREKDDKRHRLLETCDDIRKMSIRCLSE